MLAGGLRDVAARDVALATLDDAQQAAGFAGIIGDSVGTDGGEGFGFHRRRPAAGKSLAMMTRRGSCTLLKSSAELSSN